MNSVDAVKLTGGHENRIIQHDDSTCHHCGMFAGEVHSCTDCGVRAHAECVTFEEGRCDACRLHLTSDDRCVICHQGDDVPLDTQRLIRRVVYHGRTWMKNGTAMQDSVRLSSSHLCAKRLDEAGMDVVFYPEDLPNGGALPMDVVTESGQYFCSRPCVVHTWCAQCAFQQITPSSRSSNVEEQWSALLENLRNPMVSNQGGKVGTDPKIAVRTEHACSFCDVENGYLTYCYAHLDSPVNKLGCHNCHSTVMKNTTYYGFHPSCAVRWGMRRIVNPCGGGSGMMCIRSSSKWTGDRLNDLGLRRKSIEFKKWEAVLEYSSGINVVILSNLLSLGACPPRVRNLRLLGHALYAVPVALGHSGRVSRKRKATNDLDESHPGHHGNGEDAADDKEHSHASESGEGANQPSSHASPSVDDDRFRVLTEQIHTLQAEVETLRNQQTALDGKVDSTIRSLKAWMIDRKQVLEDTMDGLRMRVESLYNRSSTPVEDVDAFKERIMATVYERFGEMWGRRWANLGLWDP